MRSTPEGRRTAATLLLIAVVASGCAGNEPGQPRLVEDRERGVRLTLPPGWLWFGNEARSPKKSLLTLDVHSLEGADPRFVAGLPDSLIPQLEGWSKYYYSVVGAYARLETSIGGKPAMELTYPVQIRSKDPETKLTYWVVRHEDRVYVVRVAYPPGVAAEEEPLARSIIASWEFIPIEKPPSP